jgi:hypothetical protein
MKHFLPLIFTCLIIFSSFAQLPDGSAAPQFDVMDINGNSHNLQNYLNDGKVVILTFFSTSSFSSWNDQQLGTLYDFYYTFGEHGSDQVVVLKIEVDPLSGLNELNGNGNSIGDWISTNPYPIIDSASIGNAYNVTNAVPVTYRVCGDGLLYLIDPTASVNDLKNVISSSCVTLQEENFHAIMEVDNVNICEAGTVSDFSINVKNYGSQFITSLDFEVVNGTNVTPINEFFSIPIGANEMRTITLSALLDINESTQLELISINGSAPHSSILNNENLVLNPTVATDQVAIEIRVGTDFYPAEITWNITNDNNTVIASGGPYQPGTDDQFGGGGPDARTVKIHNAILLGIEECYTINIQDQFGDGWIYSDANLKPSIEIYTNNSLLYSTGPINENFGFEKIYNSAFKFKQNLNTQDFENFSFSLHPNPSFGIVNFKSKLPFDMEIVDLNGRTIHRAKLASNASTDLSFLQSGIYILKAKFGSFEKTEKLIIK